MITQLHPFQESNRVVVQENHITHFQFPEILLYNKYPTPNVWKLDVHSRLVSTLIDEKIFMRYLLKRYLK